MQIRVALVDDQQNMHDAVSAILDAEEDIVLVGQVYRGEDAADMCRLTKPDIVLMDVMLPGINGAEATAAVRTAAPHIKVLVLSSFRDYADIRNMLESGAVGYIVKDALVQELAETIRATAAGSSVLSQEVTATLLRGPDNTPSANLPVLTEREHAVLGAMARGLNNREIAAELAITERTVRFHMGNILDKFGVETRSEALVLAAKFNLV